METSELHIYSIGKNPAVISLDFDGNAVLALRAWLLLEIQHADKARSIVTVQNHILSSQVLDQFIYRIAGSIKFGIQVLVFIEMHHGIKRFRNI